MQPDRTPLKGKAMKLKRIVLGILLVPTFYQMSMLDEAFHRITGRLTGRIYCGAPLIAILFGLAPAETSFADEPNKRYAHAIVPPLIWATMAVILWYLVIQNFSRCSWLQLCLPVLYGSMG